MIPLLRYAACFSVLLYLAGVAQAQDKTVPRYVEFRDGSLIRLQVVEEPWKFTVVQGSGAIETTTVFPSAVKSLSLTEDEDFAKKRRLLSAVQKLGSEDFPEREKAWEELRKMGPEIRPDLQACLELTTDEETRVRLHDLLGRLPAPDKAQQKVRVAFDRFQIKSPALALAGWGYLGDQPITVLVNGGRYPLTRKLIMRVTEAAPGALQAVESPKDGFQRVAAKQFPKGCIEEGFESDPTTGRKLQIGENIEKLFVPKGFVLSTSIKTSHVSVNNFSVAGKSGGLSVANHEPLWQGEITIRFVQPGYEQLPAGVSYFGCYIAAVVPGGTELIAYDLQGRELGKIATQQHGTDFLGVRSDIPIHTIRIVPNPQIDRDYTLDDFMFVPAASAQPAHPTKFTVHLTGGDVILCKDVTLQAGKLVLQGLPGGLPDLRLPQDELSQVNFPQRERRRPTSGLFAELSDGSILFAPEPAEPRRMPTFARRPNLLKDRAGLAGLWTARYARKAHAPSAARAALWNEEEQRWEDISYVRLLEEMVLWKTADGKFAATGYQRLPPLWLAAPAQTTTPGQWHVRTTQGEELVLTGGQPLTGQLSDAVNVVWQGTPLRLSAAEVVALFQMPRK